MNRISPGCNLDPAGKQGGFYLLWRWFDGGYNNDEYHYRTDDGEPIKTFLDRTKAEAYRMQKERPERRGVSPFEMNGLELGDQTSLSVEDLRERVRALGLEPPEDDYYFEWWSLNENRFTDAQRDRIWELCDRCHFYEVVATEIELED